MVSSDEINKRLRVRREDKSNKTDNKGYLICDKCNGYYKLQKDESLDDFVDDCNCGGKLVYSKNLQNIKHDNDHKNVVTCPYCGTKNPEYSQYCMECGVKLSDAELKRKIVDLLLNLESEDPNTRSSAAVELSNFLNPNFPQYDSKKVVNIVLNFGVDSIVNALKTDNSDKVMLAWCLGYLNDEVAVKPLIESLGDRAVSGACIVNLVKLKEFSFEPLINVLSSKDKDLVNAAADALGQIKDDKAVEPLVKSFLSSSEVSYAISNALSEIKSHLAVEPLIEAMDSANIKLKRQIAFILGSIGDKRAVEPLIEALSDHDAYFRRQCVIALGKINDERATEPLIMALNDKTAVVKVAVAEYLGERGDQRLLKYLKPLLNDKNENVKKTAENAINRIGTVPKKAFVPVWNEYYPSLDSATKEQKEFYKNWLKEFKNGNPIDIEGNLSYIFVFLYDIINQFIENKDINFLLENFKRVEIGYSKYEKIKSYLSFWRISAYLYVDQRSKIWDEVTKSDMNLDAAFTCAAFLPEFDDSYFDGYKMVQIMNNEGLTRFGQKNNEKIGEIATIILEDFKIENGTHILKYFIENFNLENLTENDFKVLKTFFPKKEEFTEYKKIYNEKEKGNTKDLYYGRTLSDYVFQGFAGVPINNKITVSIDVSADDPKQFKTSTQNSKEGYNKALYSNDDIGKIYIPQIVIEAFKNEIKRIFRESENIYREEKDIPKVGEGWVSETELYYKIRNEFHDEEIIHHGRPKWLGRQHLDIYFPKRNIALEYQGEQHDSPIEYFGGEKGFKHRTVLDTQKREKCKLNNCHLIYVYPNYNFKEIKKEIKYHILKTNPEPNLFSDTPINSNSNDIKSVVNFINFDVEKLENQKRGKSKYLYENKSLFAEEVAIKYYENMGYNASWTENYYWWHIMTLIFWEEIFAPIEGVFNPFPLCTPMNDMPNDFFKPAFYQRRENLINAKISKLKNADLKVVISNSYKVNYGRSCRPIEDWDRYTLDELLIPINRMDSNAFWSLLERLISNFRDNRSGLPDLIVFNDTELFFSEVKSENDTVSNKQMEWHQFLSKMNLKIDLFLINNTERKKNNLKSKYSLYEEFKPEGNLEDFKNDLALMQEFTANIMQIVNVQVRIEKDGNEDQKIKSKIQEIQNEINQRKKELDEKLKVLSSEIVIVTVLKDKNNPNSFKFKIDADKEKLNRFVEYYKTNLSSQY